MEKIFFDDTTYIWKTKLNKVLDKSILLDETKLIIDSRTKNTTDGFTYTVEWNKNINFDGGIDIKTKLDEIVKIGIDKCKEIYKEKNIIYNKINMDAWVNKVRSINPVQIQFKQLKGVDKYHNHTQINKEIKSFFPHYTWVYYIQMPDVMNGEDGVIYFRGKNGNRQFTRLKKHVNQKVCYYW